MTELERLEAKLRRRMELSRRIGLLAFFDGACGPRNPGGTCSYGAILYRGVDVIWQCSEIYYPKEPGRTSNNIGEYCGFGSVLRYLKDNRLDSEYALICGDSKLVIEQMKGNWKIKKGLYFRFAIRAKELLSTFDVQPSLEWIPREHNTIADELSKAKLSVRI